MNEIEIGAIVRISAPGSRETSGEERRIPALVLHQHHDGTLQLYCLHFQGSPLLINAVRPDTVELVFSRNEFDAILEGLNRRITDLENQVVALGGRRREEPRFSMASE